MNGAFLFSGGRIFTGRRWAEHLLTENGRVVAVGKGPMPGRDRPTGVDRSDLEGRLVLPGFVDAHLHLPDLVRHRWGVDLRGSRSLGEVRTRIDRWRHAHPDDPVFGGGWDDTGLAERRLPTPPEIEAFAPEVPLALTRICEHLAIANRAARTALGIDRTTPDPPGGSLDRDRDGEPTGVFREAAVGYLERFPFPPAVSELETGEAVLREAAGLGIAAAASMRATPAEAEWARHRGADVGLPRLVLYGGWAGPGSAAEWGRLRRSTPRLVQGVKLFADGSLGAHSAYLEAPYEDRPGESGRPGLPPGSWTEILEAINGEGLRPAIHAIGDRALREVVTALERSPPNCRPRIEHAALMPDETLPRLAALPADLVVQPGFRRSDRWLPERLGGSRTRTAYRWADARRAGIRLAGSSDAPVEPLDPWDGLRCAVAGSTIGQSLAPLEALELYLGGAASVLGLPDHGHLEPGARASLVVFESRSIETLLQSEDPPPRSVWIDGRPVAAGLS